MEKDIKVLQNKLLEMLKDFDAFCKENNIQYTLAGGNVLGAVRHKGFIPWDDDIDVFLTRENYNKFLEIFNNNEKYTLQRDNIDYPLQFSKLRLNNSTFIEDIKYRKKYRNIHQGLFIDLFPMDKISTNKRFAKKQTIFANIVIAQSLFLRGYQRLNLKKSCVIFIGILLLPFRKKMIEYVKSFNNEENFDYYCSFYGMRRKIYQNKNSFIGDLPLLQFEDSEFPVMKDYIKYLEDVYGDYMKIPSQKEIEYNVHAKYFDINKSYIDYIE